MFKLLVSAAIWYSNAFMFMSIWNEHMCDSDIINKVACILYWSGIC